MSESIEDRAKAVALRRLPDVEVVKARDLAANVHREQLRAAFVAGAVWASAYDAEGQADG